MKTIKIPYEDLELVNRPYMENLLKISKEVIESGRYILGKKVSDFENEFAQKNKINHCVGVASGLDALILSFSVFDFPKGSKVLVPSNAYIACILSIIRAGLTPVLVEPNIDTCNIEIDGIISKYSKDCVAILCVHMYGRMCPMHEIVSFAREHNLIVIEDCAQSHFAELNGRNAGTYGDLGAFSFYPTKNLGALGDAGAIICNSKVIYEKLIALRNYGSHIKYFNKYIGWNSRLDEIQAAFLSVKLMDAEKVINKKRKLAKLYIEKLGNVPQLKLPIQEYKSNVWHIFNIRCKQRDELKVFLYNHGVGTEIHYPVAPNFQEGYSTYFKDWSCPISEQIHRETLSLPISAWLDEESVNYICSKVKLFFEK